MTKIPRLLALMGSPRVGKNTDHLCNAALEGAKQEGAQIDKINLNKLSFEGCRGCNACHKTGECIVNDDYSEIYQKYDQSDCIVIATPIYYHSVTSQLKAAIDRTQAFWSSKYVAGVRKIDPNKLRLGLFLATGGAPISENAFAPAKQVIQTYFRAINTTYWDELFVPNTDKQPVWERDDLLLEAHSLGKHLIQAWQQKQTNSNE